MFAAQLTTMIDVFDQTQFPEITRRAAGSQRYIE